MLENEVPKTYSAYVSVYDTGIEAMQVLHTGSDIPELEESNQYQRQ